MSIFKNRTVVGVLCILLSLLICFGVTPLFNSAVSQKTEIVRVVKEIKVGDEITKDMVQTVEVGGFGLPDNVIRQSETAVGKFAAADLSVGDYILSDKLTDTPASENAYLYNLDGTMQAMSVTIKSFADGLSGKLRSGDALHGGLYRNTSFPGAWTSASHYGNPTRRRGDRNTGSTKMMLKTIQMQMHISSRVMGFLRCKPLLKVM